MTFSASMSVVEYYLLKRFPVPYGKLFTDQQTLERWKPGSYRILPSLIPNTALYFVAVATVAAFVGQFVVRKLINLLGRASLIIFILSFTIFVSAISLGMCCYRTVSLIDNSNGFPWCFPPFFPSIMVCFPLQTGGVGIVNMIQRIERHEYMGFDNICSYEA